MVLPVALFSANTPKAEPVVMPPAPVLSIDEVQQLRATIAGLHQRFEDQGKILAQLRESLDALRTRLDRDLHAVDLAPLRDSVATLANRVTETRAAVGQLAAALDKASADNGAQTLPLTNEVARLKDRIATLDGNLARLRDDVREFAARAAVRPAPIVPPAPSLLPLLATTAACAVVLGALVLYFGLKPRAAPPADPTAALAALEKQLAELRREVAARREAPAPPEMPAAWAEAFARLETIAVRFAGPAASSAPESAPIAVPAKSETRESKIEYSPALWPAPFLVPDSPLARWRAALEADLASPEHLALPVVAALLALRVVVARPAPAAQEVADAVAALSTALYEYWQSRPGLTDDARLEASGHWIDGVREMIAQVAPNLSIEQMVPGPRFDAATMQTVRQGPGNHLNVAEVFSWAIRDLSGERPKILHRARVATT